MRFLNAGFVAISEAAGSDFELLNLNNIYVDKNGFIYIYVSNESNVNVNVYFDDMKVTHFKSEIVQADDYYPFGLGATVKKMSCGHFQGAARERSGQGCRHRLHPHRGQGESVPL